MLKKFSYGFSIVELLIAMAVFSFFITSTAVLVFSGEDAAQTNTHAMRALILAQEGLEATRAIRDGNWSDLIEGDHGLLLNGDTWEFTGTSDITEDTYRRTVSLIPVNESKFQVISKVNWINRSGVVKEKKLVSCLTNWQREQTGSGGGVDLGDSARDLYVAGNYTYLAVDDQHKSLVVVDTTDPLNGQVVATKDLNGKGIDVYIDNDYAYIVLDTNKVTILDIANPQSPQQVASINLSSHPTSILVQNGYAYIGQDKKNEGLVIYNVANPELPYFYNSYNIEGHEVYDVKIVNGWVYVAVNAGRGFDVSDEGYYAYAYVAVDLDDAGFEIDYLWGSVIDLVSAMDIGSPASNVFLHNNIAYVAAQKVDGGLVKIDVSSAGQPSLIEAVDVGGEGNGVFYKDGYVYMAVENTDNGLRVVPAN
jgi:prepilin-type N-terminal cleavage/methylation domain-containing protein